MPPPEGFADVGQQLLAVRRRANHQALLATVCGALCVVVLLGAAVLAAGVWGSGAVFRITVGAALAVAAVAVGGAAVHTWRHRIDLAAAARIADRGAGLQERLTTVVTLAPAGRRAPLLPLLIAQTGALRDRWRPETVVPRRLPRSALALLAAVAVLGGLVTWLRFQPLERLTRARTAAAPSPAPRSGERREPANPPRSLPPGERPEDTEPANVGAPSRSDPRDRADDAAHDPVDSPDAADADEATANPLVALPAQLQRAIREAVRGETAGRATSLAATGKPQRGDGTDAPRAGDGTARGAAGAVTPGTPRDATARLDKDRGDESPPDADAGSTGPTARNAGIRPARPDESGSGDQPRDGKPKPAGGAAPPAGRGTSAGTLLAQKAGGPAAGAAAAAPFKVTITSFLEALDQESNRPRSGARRGGAGGASRPAPALSDSQLADDLLRKAEVPPEYEELVRRVYSTREEP